MDLRKYIQKMQNIIVKYNGSITYQNQLSASNSVSRDKFMTSNAFKMKVDYKLK